jgi:Ca2+/Na+ antiporter
MIMLLWCFMGVAIVSDVFMCAIEMITSKEAVVVKEVTDARSGRLVRRRFHERVWNPTVANLTLMALGSSAPEILLNVIEIFSKDFFAGELGPSTIVGSAAFNLMVISAVCVVAIPNGESRKIEDRTVFGVTAMFSVFAYIWVYFILLISSPEIITPVEGLLTFVFFFVLIGLAYAADKGWLGVAMRMHADGHGRKTDKAVDASSDKVENNMGVPVTGTPLAGANVCAALEDGDAAMMPPSPFSAATPVAAFAALGSPLSVGTPGFISCSTPVRGGVTSLALKGLSEETAPHDNCSAEVKPSERFATIDAGELHEGPRLPPSRASRRVLATRWLTGGRISVPKNIDEASADDISKFSQVVPVPEFTAKPSQLSSAKCLNLAVDSEEDTRQSILCFELDAVEVCENVGTITVQALRRHCLESRVSCRFSTMDGSGSSAAVAGADYVSCEGELIFEPGEAKKSIEVQILNDKACECDEHFLIVLSDATQACFDASTNGSEGRCISTVTIRCDDLPRGMSDRLSLALGINHDQLQLGHGDYWSQIVAACLGPAAAGDDDEDTRSIVAWTMHLVSLPWKLAFALVPPPVYFGGWLCFFVALVFIGVLTAIIGDFASHMGDAMGLQASVTAITFVALGTSLPDTFASKAAAVADPTADAAIGNIVGSNSVNVFLGLGLPWMIAAFYWTCGVQTGSDMETAWISRYGSGPSGTVTGFVVPAGDLGLSVIVFTACAMVTLGTLLLRRWAFGCELGGPRCAKFLTAALFVTLWLVYVLISSLKAYGHI